MKILLTGGSGFIGKNLREQLSKKYDLVAPFHRELDLLDETAVRSFLEAEKFDVVIHAANYGGKRTQTDLVGVFETNKRMFFNLANNQHLFGRMIFLGSGAEYGKQRPIVKVKETDFGKVRPQDEYGQSKYLASEYIAEHNRIVNLRLFGVYGKYEDYKTRFISNAICRALYGLPIVIRQNVRFDFLYVNDLINIIEYFINTEAKEKFYNTGTGHPVDLEKLAVMVKEIVDVTEIIVKNPGLGREYTCDNGLLVKELGNFSFTPPEVAIKEMVLWYKENLQQIKREDLEFDR